MSWNILTHCAFLLPSVLPYTGYRNSEFFFAVKRPSVFLAPLTSTIVSSHTAHRGPNNCLDQKRFSLAATSSCSPLIGVVTKGRRNNIFFSSDKCNMSTLRAEEGNKEGSSSQMHQVPIIGIIRPKVQCQHQQPPWRPAPD